MSRGQPAVDLAGGDKAARANGLQRFQHGAGIGQRRPGPMLGQPPPCAGQPEGRAGSSVRGRKIGAGSGSARRRQLGRQAARYCRHAVGAGQAGIAEGEVLRMNPDLSVGQPARRFAIGHPGAETLRDGSRGRLGARLKPRNAVLRQGKRRQQGMPVVGFGHRLARQGMAGRLKGVVGLPCGGHHASSSSCSSPLSTVWSDNAKLLKSHAMNDRFESKRKRYLRISDGLASDPRTALSADGAGRQAPRTTGSPLSLPDGRLTRRTRRSASSNSVLRSM